MNIAILGWGSLLWDKRRDFEEQHAEWEFDGPELKIEFSRISSTRSGALTLVIDPASGSPCRVAHVRSKRTDPDDAVRDLRFREETTATNIGLFFADGTRLQSKDEESVNAVRTWASRKNVDVVVWTDLSSNFFQTLGQPFSIENALLHLQALDSSARSCAAAYVSRAPDFVVTRLRASLRSQPWFK